MWLYRIIIIIYKESIIVLFILFILNLIKKDKIMKLLYISYSYLILIIKHETKLQQKLKKKQNGTL